MEREPRSEALSHEAVLARLEAAVGAIQDSESFQQYLAVQARFPRYSWANVALILSQRPDATAVAGFRTWQELDRFVKRGEHGIRILAPRFRKDAESDERTLTGFFPVSVFDLSQTEGRPLPSVEVPRLEGEEGGRLFETALAFANDHHVRVRLGTEQDLGAPDINGLYDPTRGEIRVRSNPMPQMAKTLLHELSHYVHIKHIGEESENQEERETVAEGSAYVVAQHFGLETGQYSFPYIAAWAKQRERLTGQLGVIQRVASVLIDGMEGKCGTGVEEE
jgi:hypothetical protein